MMGFSSKWMGLLAFLLVILATVSAQEFNTPESDAYMHELSNRQDVGGLAGWAAMGSGIRRLALNGYPTEFINALASGEQFNQESITLILNYLTPIMVLLGFCIAFAVVVCFVCPCFYCCRSCGNCGGSQPKIEGYTPNERICAIVTMAIGLTMISIGFIIGLVSNGVLNQGVGDVQFAIGETVGDVLGFPEELGSAAIGMIGEATIAVDDVIAIIQSVPEGIIGPTGTINLIVGNVTDNLRQLQDNWDNLNQRALDIGGFTDNLEENFDQLNADLQDSNDRMADLREWQESNEPGEFFRVNTTCLGFADFVVVNVTGLFPDFTELLANITTVNLTATADSVDEMFATISDNVTSIMDEQFSAITGNVEAVLEGVEGTINSTLNGTIGSIFGVVEQAQSMIGTFSDDYVVPINHWRYIVMAILFSFSMLAVVVCLVGFFLKKSPLMTCSAIFCFLLIILYWIICALHLILAAPIGKVCDIYYDRAILEVIPEGLINFGGDGGNNAARRLFTSRAFGLENLTQGSPIFSGEATFEDYINLFYDGVDYCHNGGNIVDFLNITTVVDVDDLIDGFIDDMNITSMVNNIDFDFLGDVDFTEGLNFSQVSEYLGYLDDDYSVYLNLIENIAFGPLEATINLAITVFEEMETNDIAVEACLEHNITAPATLDAAIDSVQAEISQILVNLNHINDTIMNEARDNIAGAREALYQFELAANATAEEFLEILEKILTFNDQVLVVTNEIKDKLVNHTIPDVIAEIKGLAVNVISSAREITECQWIADDLLGTLGSICIQTVGGLDTVWVTCGYLALMLVLAIVGITLVAKRWIRADTMDQEYGEDYYQNNEYELPPMYSENYSGKA